MQISVFTSDSPLSKTFRRGPGGVEKIPGGKLTRGFVERKSFLDLEDFSKFISGLNGVNALAYGIPKHDHARVLSQRELESEKGGDLPVITRTRSEFAWPAGEGVMMLDHDVRKDRDEPLTPDQLLTSIISICPDLVDAPMLLTHSASSYIYDGDTLVSGPKGMRIYIHVKDARDIPRAGNALFKRLWLSGRGYVEIGQNGRMQNKTLIDASVWRPEGLDFAGGAHCEPPVRQDRPGHLLMNADFEAEPFDTTLIKDLDEDEERMYQELVKDVRKLMEQEASRRRAEWLLSLPEDQRAAAETATLAGILPADFVLTSVDDEEFTVREALADKERYHGTYVRHPFEPDYQDNEKLAQLKLDHNPKPCVHTFAHGNETFWLDTAEAAFADVEPPAGPMEYPEQEKKAFTIDVDWLCDIDITTTPPRDWILGNRYIRGYPTITIAPGGGSKSTLAMTEMLSLAYGVELTGAKIFTTGKVWIINSEDPKDEIHRRIWAICNFFGLPPKHPNVAVSGAEFKFCLAQESKDGMVVIKYDHVDPIKRYIQDNKILLWSLDPLIRTHKISENDNVGIDALARLISEMCRDTSSCCSAVHHTRKGNDIAGNMDSARGASALISAARIADTLTVMSEKEMKKLMVDERRRKFYVRLDGAKSNLRAPAEDTKWFERIDVKLPNSDSVGVLRPKEFDEVEENQMDPLHRAIINHLAVEIPVGERWTVNRAAQLIFDKYGSDLKTEKDKTPSVRTIANHILQIYQECPQIVGRSEIRYVRAKGSGKNGEHFLSASWISDEHL